VPTKCAAIEGSCTVCARQYCNPKVKDKHQLIGDELHQRKVEELHFVDCSIRAATKSNPATKHENCGDAQLPSDRRPYFGPILQPDKEFLDHKPEKNVRVSQARIELADLWRRVNYAVQTAGHAAMRR
jgi:hypothetical protein